MNTSERFSVATYFTIKGCLFYYFYFEIGIDLTKAIFFSLLIQTMVMIFTNMVLSLLKYLSHHLNLQFTTLQREVVYYVIAMAIFKLLLAISITNYILPRVVI